jgi:hypothetical protein
MFATEQKYPGNGSNMPNVETRAGDRGIGTVLWVVLLLVVMGKI